MKTRLEVWDCLIIGGGPAALAAAVYTAREDISTLIFEKAIIGGLAAVTAKVDNYPGFADGVGGLELASQLEAQAKRFGAEIELGTVEAIEAGLDGVFRVVLANGGGQYHARSVLVATGSEWKKLGVSGEAELYGRGVHHCATCDGAFYRDKRLVVVGGGNSAAQESLFLTKFASQIDIMIRRDQWRASEALVREVLAHPKIKVHHHRSVTAIKARADNPNQVGSVILDRDGQADEMATDGVFVFVGLRPVTNYLAKTEVVLDEQGFVVSNRHFQTNVDGIFVAGDVRSGATMQIASAVGEGASAALAIRHYLDSQKKELAGQPPNDGSSSSQKQDDG